MTDALNQPGALEREVARQLLAMISEPAAVNVNTLEMALRLLAKWRTMHIDRTIVARDGTDVQSGPFARMHFVSQPSEASLSPKLLGLYEAELHPLIAEIAKSDLTQILDVGCADGYYAVGFARLMPHVQVLAHDINPAARQHCADLAARNGVSDRVRVGGEISGEDFETVSDDKTLLFIDIEGAEEELLRPDLYPALRRLKILVECHDAFRPGLSNRIADRFAPSHDLRTIPPALTSSGLPSWMSQLSQIDQLLATWECRIGATPWLFMTPRSS